MPSVTGCFTPSDMRGPFAFAEGLDLDRITRALEHEGVKAFCDSYHHLVDCIQTKVQHAVLVR